jgi:hypothetical protein
MLFLKQNYEKFAVYDRVAEAITDEEDYQGDILSYFNFAATNQQKVLNQIQVQRNMSRACAYQTACELV